MSDEDRWERPRRRRWPFRGSFFEDFEEILKEMEELMGEGSREFPKALPKDLVRERVLPDGSKVKEWGPFVYGYSITVGPDGKPEVREFGNVKPRMELGKRRLDFTGEREPLVDVVETDGEIKVIVELPGVAKDDIRLQGTEDSLAVSVDTPQRKYHKVINLPVLVDHRQARSSYKNGVLETILPKKEEKTKGEAIKID